MKSEMNKSELWTYLRISEYPNFKIDARTWWAKPDNTSEKQDDWVQDKLWN